MGFGRASDQIVESFTLSVQQSLRQQGYLQMRLNRDSNKFGWQHFFVGEETWRRSPLYRAARRQRWGLSAKGQASISAGHDPLRRSMPPSTAPDNRLFLGLLVATMGLAAAFNIFAYLRPDIFSPDGGHDFIHLIPRTAREFKLVFGGAFVIGLLIFSLVMWRAAFFDRHFKSALIGCVAAWAVFLFAFTFAHTMNIDEREALQTIWKMHNGLVPYVDFFQHHHPLLWIQSLPVMALLGPSATLFFALRLVQFLFVAGIAIATYKTARLITASAETGIVAVLLLLTFFFFVSDGIEIRPDVEQTFFCVWSFYFFVKHLFSSDDHWMAASGASAAVAFIYLQKALFFLFPLGLVMVYLLSTRRIRWRRLIHFCLAFSVPCLVFIGAYVLSGQAEEYLVFNWVLNAVKESRTAVFQHYAYLLVWNPHLWLGTVLYLAFWIVRRGTIPFAIHISFFVGIVIFVIAAASPRAWSQYYMVAFPFLAIPVAVMVRESIKGFQKNTRLGLYCLLVFGSAPVFLVEFCYPQSNQEVFRIMRDNIGRHDEYAYDERIRYNLFKRDLSFFWFSTHRDGMLDSYRTLVEDDRFDWRRKQSYGDFAFCNLIAATQPRVVYTRGGSENRLEDCETREHYVQVFSGYYVDRGDGRLYHRRDATVARRPPD